MENFFAQWGLVLSILALAAAIGGGLVAFGRFQGKIGEKTNKHEKDIDRLWDHQRAQDDTTTEQGLILAGIKETLKYLKESSDDVKERMMDILKEVRK